MRSNVMMIRRNTFAAAAPRRRVTTADLALVDATIRVLETRGAAGDPNSPRVPLERWIAARNLLAAALGETEI
jgi:hypothetical protein